jgi:DNA-binding protein HU-beta
MPVKRTVMRSSKGTKLYAVRDAKGRFKDIQSYKRAHSMDIKRKSKAELAKAKSKTKAKPKAKAKRKK